MLEKAILLDQLNSKISHRPGPLDLIEKNILHAEEPIERIVKEGLLFKAEPTSNQSFQYEDDSQSSEGDQQQQQIQQIQQQQIQQIQHIQPQLITQNHLIEISTDNTQSHLTHIQKPARNMLETAAASAGIINISVAMPKQEYITTTPMATVNFQVPSPAYNIVQTTTKKTSFSSEIPPPPPPPIKTETITYLIKQEKTTPPPALIKSNSSNLLQLIPDIGSPVSTSSSLSPASSIASPSPITVISKPNISTILQSNQKYCAPGKDKNRKKAKNKPVSKIRAIKFHEYKGPPNAQKNNPNLSSNSSNSSSASSSTNRKSAETNYELILQQQCLLEYLEGIYNPPNSNMKTQCSNDVSLQSNSSSCSNSIICDSPSSIAESNNNGDSLVPETGTITVIQTEKLTNINTNPIVVPTPMTATLTKIVPKQQVTIFPSPATPAQSPASNISVNGPTDLAKLNKMKVSDLKAYLKKLNLPVSGPKPLLIERLKPFLPLDYCDNSEDTISSSNSQEIDNYASSRQSVSSESDHDFMDVQQVESPPSYNPVVSSSKEDDIVKEQQRTIQELQRKLEESRQQLAQMKQNHSQPATNENVTSTAIEEIKKEPELEPETNIIFAQKPLTFIPNQQFQINGQMPTVLLFDVPHAHSHAEQKTIISAPLPPLIETGKKLSEPSSNKCVIQPKFILDLVKQQPPQSSPKIKRMEDPPGYEEAAANSSKKLQEKSTPMSQEITDVLEILIQQGELPESAVDPNHDFSHLMIDPNTIFDPNTSPVLNPVSSSSDIKNDYNIMSPMHEDNTTISSSEKTMDKLLGQAQNNMPSVQPMPQYQDKIMQENPSSSSNLSNPSSILPDFHDMVLDFPMDIEDEASTLSPLHVTNYNTNNKLSNSTNKTTQLDNCDNNLSLFTKTSSNFGNSTKDNNTFNSLKGSGSIHENGTGDINLSFGIGKTLGFIENHPLHSHQLQKTNDSLISNFNHHNGLDTFSSNNTNSINNNNPQQQNLLHHLHNQQHNLNNNVNPSNNSNSFLNSLYCNNKPDDNHLMRFNNANNLNLSNNNESTPMDFENIFDNELSYGHMTPFDTTLFNDIDFRMNF